MLGVSALALAMSAAPALAQGDETRPAATTFWGDTGLWFVPIGEVLPQRDLSFSVQRTESDFRQGNTNVSFWPVTAAVGLGRVEAFGALRVITRIDRDTSPLLFGDPAEEAGGLVNDYPTVRDSWSGNRLGDLYLGAKVNLSSQQRGQGIATALRGTVKFPTANSSDGTGTGAYDWFADVIASGETGGVELAGFSGFALRGDPDNVSLSDGLRWGAGAAFPARRSLRATAEVFGEYLFDDAVTAPPGFVVGGDGSVSPATSQLQNEITTAVGLTWQHASGALLGAAVHYTFGLDSASTAGQAISRSGDGFGVEFRIGFHRGLRSLALPPPAVALAAPPPPPPSPPPAPAAAAPAPNRPPVVKAVCSPCRVESGQSITVRADSTDPDGDPVTFRWSATGGTLGATRDPATSWRAESAPGPITVRVTAEDSRGASATDAITVEVTPLPVQALGDVRFAFDSARIEPDAVPVLDAAVAALKQHPDRGVVIEGHTCSLGTPDYNKGLGERRAEAVRDYLVQHGVAPDRLSIVTFGEDRPHSDNVSEAHRRMNRRGVLVMRATSEAVRQ
jgi:outer membrane protein OmpA-like peptidoglycan-associated protein